MTADNIHQSNSSETGVLMLLPHNVKLYKTHDSLKILTDKPPRIPTQHFFLNFSGTHFENMYKNGLYRM